GWAGAGWGSGATSPTRCGAAAPPVSPGSDRAGGGGGAYGTPVAPRRRGCRPTAGPDDGRPRGGSRTGRPPGPHTRDPPTPAGRARVAQAGTAARATRTSPLPVRPRTCSAVGRSGGSLDTVSSLRAVPEPEATSSSAATPGCTPMRTV